MLLYKKAENSRPWQFVLLTCFPHQSLKWEKYKEFEDNEKKKEVKFFVQPHLSFGES